MSEACWHQVSLPSPLGVLEQLEAGIDWEPLYCGIRGAMVTKLGQRSEPLGRVTIFRGDEYAIRGVVETSLEIPAIEALSTGIVGRLVKDFELEALANYTTTLRSTDCAIGRCISESTVNAPTRTFVELIIPTMTLHFGNQSPAAQAVTTEWFISGPSQVHFPRRTVREIHQRVVRRRIAPATEREDVPAVVRPPIERGHNEHFGFDYLLLQLAKVKALVAEVPKKYHPEWSTALSIEYHHEKGQVPDDSLRELVADALGFLFGRQLLCIGHTGYDADGYPVEQYACQAWGHGVRKTCMAPDLPPFRLRSADIEPYFNQMVAAFVDKAVDYGLREALWMIWMALRMPVGFDLPLYAAALERIMIAWFKSTRSKSKGVYMPKTQFESLLVDDFSSIETRLGGRQYADRILRRIRGAFQMGVNERFEIFFAELELPCGAVETEAIRARNDFAHPGGKRANDDQKQVKLGRAYMTLLNRVILKVLGHKGTYTDYCTDYHQEKRLDEPIGPL